jgi:hypothetical protein
MQKRKLSGDFKMTGILSEMEGHPAKNSDHDALFGEGRNLNVSNVTVFISSPAMKPSLSLNMPHTPNALKRGFEDSSSLWGRAESAMEWDMRSPEHIKLDELDDMLDDF